MTTAPTAQRVCERCGRSGTREFVTVGTGRWECTNGTACRRRSIQAARRQKAARAPLAELPTLLGGGTVESDGDGAWFEIDTGCDRDTAEVEYHPDEEHPFQVWVRSWGPDHRPSSESEGGAFDTSAEAAKQVSTILAAIARSQAELQNLLMITREQAGDRAEARTEGCHAELRREGSRECEAREPSSDPPAVDVEARNRSWPIA